MRKTILLLPLFLMAAMLARAQNLDRLSLSSGGAASDNINYVLGETFNFTFATGGDIIIETGTLGSDDNTGIELTDRLEEIAQESSLISCYPNPAKNILTVDFNAVEGVTNVLVLNELGQVVKQANPNGARVYLNVRSLSPGGYFVMTLCRNKVLGINKIVKQ